MDRSLEWLIFPILPSFHLVTAAARLQKGGIRSVQALLKKGESGKSRKEISATTGMGE